jgi:hypothetical protein
LSADAIVLDSSSPETGDFLLAPDEIAKGERAAAAYIDSLKPAKAN